MNRREVSILGGKANGEKRKEKALKDYYENPVFCKQCSKLIEPVFEKRKDNKTVLSIHATRRKVFCSPSCSATYNNSNNTKRVSHTCENPECNKLTNNKRFCSNQCSSENLRLLKIQRFLNGELNDNGVRRNAIRDFLIERQEGICPICRNKPLWNLKPIIFVIDHIDGNYENNNPSNIRAICPNCNSQTFSFSGKNNDKVKHVTKRAKSNPNRK